LRLAHMFMAPPAGIYMAACCAARPRTGLPVCTRPGTGVPGRPRAGIPRGFPLGSVPAQSCVRRARHSIAPSCVRRALHCIGVPGRPRAGIPARGSPRIRPRTVLRPSRTAFHRTVLRLSRTSLHRSPGAPARWDPRAWFPSDPSPHSPVSVAHVIPSHRPASVAHFIASESRGARALGSPRGVPLGSVPAQEFHFPSERLLPGFDQRFR